MGSIPEVPLARRREILALPKDPNLAQSLRVVAWNAQRFRNPEASAAMFRETGAGIFLLSELDCGMARSQQRHTAREPAARLDWFFARGLEVSEAAVIDAVDPETGSALSDHEAIAVTIRCR